MKLAYRIIEPLGQTHRPARCAVDLVIDAHAICVSDALEFGDIVADASGTRSLSEFDVSLFAPLAPGEGERVRVRKMHSYEGATSTLRDLWFEARPSNEGPPVLLKSSALPSASQQRRSRVWWMLDTPQDEPSLE